MGLSDLWRRKKHEHTDSEAVHAKMAAELALEQAKAQRPSVEVVSSSLRKLNSENHYADRIAYLIRGGTPQ